MNTRFLAAQLISCTLLLTSCAPAPTRIALTIEYDDAWEIGLMEIRGNSGETERDVRLPAQHSLEIWVPESWAGQEARFRVRGLHGSNDAIATGTGIVVPVLGTTTPLTITLHRVACGAWCTEGETRCFGDAVAACAQRDLDPCMEWGPSIPCPPDAPFCSLGQCRTECIDECAENEMRCDGPNGYQICGNFDGDSCREWSTTTTCGEGQTCDSGTCAAGCRNQCTAGATQCSGSAIVTCGDLNDDGCTEWGPTARCATGSCEGDRCVEVCSDDCEVDECVCNNPPAQTCVGSSSLRVYDAVGECTAGDCSYTSRDIRCDTPPAATCVDANTARTYAPTGECTGDRCTYRASDTTCPTGCSEGRCHPTCPGLTDKVDVLLMVDNSNSMAEEQESLNLELPRLVTRLSAVAPSIHLGVITSDMGIGGFEVPSCELRRGDDGRLLSMARGGDAMCTGPYPSVFEFQRGVDDAAAFAQRAGCVARVGIYGCGFEQQLEAVLKALSPSRPQSWTATDYTPPIFEGNTLGHGDGTNAGFIREDSVLAVLLLTDEEDCSAANPELFDPDSTTFTAPLNLRCFTHPEATHPIGRFVDGLSRLRRDPRRFVYAAIVGIPLDADPGSTTPNYAAILDHPSMVEREDPTTERLIPSCDVDDRGVAFPARRIVSVARDLNVLGAGTAVHSICQADYGAAIENISRVIASRASSLCE